MHKLTFNMQQLYHSVNIYSSNFAYYSAEFDSDVLNNIVHNYSMHAV